MKKAKVAQSCGKESTIHHLFDSVIQLQKKCPFAKLRLTVSLTSSDDILFCCCYRSFMTVVAVYCLVSPEKKSEVKCETAAEAQVSG